MKKVFLSAIIALFSISAFAQSSFTVGSYNMRYRNGDIEMKAMLREETDGQQDPKVYST